jgi:ABC-type branched-subunit amino acid transport system substrate-binding protein
MAFRTACKYSIFVTLLHTLVGTNFADAQQRTLGVVLPLSGPLGALGQEISEGIKIAAKTNPSTSIVLRDDGGDLPRTQLSFRELIERERVPLIVGLPTAGAATVVSELATRAAIPVIHLSSYLSAKSTNEMIFGLAPSAGSLIDAAVEFAKGELQIKSAVILFGISRQYEDLAQSLNDRLRQVGVEVSLRRLSLSDDPDRIADLPATSDLIVVGPIPVRGELLTRARVVIIDPTPLLPDGSATRLSFQLSRGSGFLISIPQANQPEFEIRSDEAAPPRLAGARAYGFTLGEIAFQAIQRANGDPRGIAEELRRGEFNTLIFGKVRFSREGFSNLKPVLFRVERGRLTSVSTCRSMCR